MSGSNIRHRVRLEEPGSTVRETWGGGHDKHMKFHGSLPVYSVAVVFVSAWAMFSMVSMLSGILPMTLTLKDEAANPGRFITERAWNHLLQLTSFGPKITGSYENEVLAVDFLAREVNFIIQQAHPSQLISLDIQKATGSYQLTFVNSYSEVQNIVVRLHSATNSTSSLLINCHFDTVPKSPGASDDGLNCAVMLEVLRVLSRQDTPLQSDVIFLFNGAEEAPLKASHGFITQHKWAETVRAFINLEACGAGGREILFQAGPQHAWLVKLYADVVPHPHGLVVAEELFQSGLVPSDTDFRIFRDYGHVPGLDFAHAMNGYVYHTQYDSVDFIPRGTLQHTGDNLLALVKSVASSPQLENTDLHSGGRAVYYDIIGFFMVCYSEQAALVVNLLAVALSVYSAYLGARSVMPGRSGKECVLQLVLGCVVVLAGWVLGAGAAAAVATALDVLHSSMSWFTHTSLVFGLYYLPALAGMAAPLLLQECYRARCKASIITVMRVQVNCCCVQLLWTLLLLVSVLAGVRSGFALMLLVVFPALAGLLLALLRVHKSAKMWLVTFFVSSLVPIPFMMYLTQLAFGLFIPITGRIGPDKNPDLLIALLAALTCILSSSYVVPLVVLVRDRAKVAVGLAVVFLLAFALAAFTPIGFPFRESRDRPTPQRVLAFHAERTVMGADGEVSHHGSGYWLLPFDRHNVRTVRGLISEVEDARSVSEDCKQHLYCALPVYWSRMVPILSKSYWVPAAAPVIHNPATLELKAQSMVSVKVRRLVFTAKGVDNMAVFLAPVAGVKLTGWSLYSGDPTPGPEWLGRPSYFIHNASGTANYTLQLSLDFEVPFNTSGPVVDIGIAGHYLSDKNNMGAEFKKFCAKYPPWAHVTAWTATVKLFKY